MAQPPTRPTAVEVATGIALGQGEPRRPKIHSRPAPHPLAALERAVLPALSRQPCVVGFSGGMDSSFVLAVAERLARRKGLPAPIPVTWRAAGAPRTADDDWREGVVAALDLPDWAVLPAEDDLDLVGPPARRMLRRHGVQHPVHLHLHLPVVAAAAGGSLLTGTGGDQVLAGWRRPGGRPLRGRYRPPEPFPWLRPVANAHLRRGYLAERRAEPRGAGARIRWHAGRRDLMLTSAGLSAIAADADVAVVNPLLDPGFLGSLAAGLGRSQPPSRSDLLVGMAAGTLPPVVTAPRATARRPELVLRGPTRAFIGGWDGSGVDGDLVDVAALRATWSRWPIPPATAGLVQQAWLATAPASLTKALH